ncbi:MAG TPA: gluconolactonase [Planctomycetaceae bacterium]|nr:gluconolactonase [Planctomycetaceae bacterium]
MHVIHLKPVPNGLAYGQRRSLIAFTCFSALAWVSVSTPVRSQSAVKAERTSPPVTLEGLGPTGPVELIQGEFQFTEGPAWTPDGSLYFTDIPAEKIMRLGPGGQIKTFLEPSLHANGLMYGGKGRLLACQMDGRLVAIDLKTKKTKVLTDSFEDTRYNACNDLVIDRQGGIYFTDPRYRAPEPWPQGKEAFYYLSADGKLTRLGDDLTAPNGIALSPDEKTLYVIPSMSSKMMAYPVQSPGQIGDGHVLFELKQPEGKRDTGGDGLAIDSQGNLYITTALGVQVVSPDGKLLGIIRCPEHPANCGFGGEDLKTLFITARTGLYQVRVPVAGHLQRR